MRVKTWLAAVCAAAMIGGAVVGQPPKTEPAKTETPKAPEGAKGGDSLLTMIADARGALGKTRDYTCTFTRQEMRNGALGAEQVAEMKVRTNPGGVYVRFAKPDTIAGMEVAYTATRKTSKFQYRAAGIAGAKGFKLIDLDDSKFMAENRHPVTGWTMSAVLDRVAAATARENTLKNAVEVYTGDFQFAGRNVTRYEILTRRQHAFRYAHRMLVYIDKETKLPLRYEAYGEPKAGGAVGDLFEAYSFSDVKLNVGLGENVFDY